MKKVRTERFLLMGFYAEIENIDHANGTFTVYGSVRAANTQDLNGTIVGADYGQDKLHPVIAYWVYA